MRISKRDLKFLLALVGLLAFLALYFWWPSAIKARPTPSGPLFPSWSPRWPNWRGTTKI